MAVAEVSLESIDLTDYALYRHGFPHPVFTFLRREAPVWKHPDTAVLRDAGARPFWVLVATRRPAHREPRHGDLRRVRRRADP